MVKISITLADEIKEIMDQHKEVKWEELAQDFIWEYAKKLDLADKLASTSSLSDKDALEIGQKIKEGLISKYK
ncbi:hypothetical protein ACFL52_02050 [Candidatus Margulisiibacteriota bacterium]